MEFSRHIDTDVCMLVHNSVTADVRVMKEALSLAGCGWNVTIVGVLKGDEALPREEVVSGIRIIRVPAPSWTWHHLLSRPARRHKRAERDRMAHGPTTTAPAQTPSEAETPRVAPAPARSSHSQSNARLRRIFAFVPQGSMFRRALRVGYRVLRAARRQSARAYYRLRSHVRRLFYRLRRAGDGVVRGVGRKILASNDGLLIGLRIVRILKKIDARVYHAHDYPALVQISRAVGRRSPIVYDSHELFFDRQPPDSPQSVQERQYRFERWQEKVLARRAAAVVTVSDGIADLMARKWERERPLVVRNAVDIRGFKEPAASYGSGSGRIVVHSGNVTFGRHLPELVRSLRYLPSDVRLVLMGTAREHTLPPLLSIAESDGTHERLMVVPPVPIDRVAPTLAQADVGVVLFTSAALNYRLGLPNKFFEYVAAGLPVVVGQAQEIVRVVKQYDMGPICDETSPESIAEAIATVLDPEHYQRYKANVLHARNELNWQVEEEKLIELYAGLLA